MIPFTLNPELRQIPLFALKDMKGIQKKLQIDCNKFVLVNQMISVQSFKFSKAKPIPNRLGEEYKSTNAPKNPWRQSFMTH